jgi:uncharacterized protein (TIGR02466 family)
MIEEIFPTIILNENVSYKFGNEFNSTVYNRSKELQKNSNEYPGWNCDTFNTRGINLKDDDIFKDFCNFVKTRTMALIDNYKFDKKYKLKMVDLWVNIASPGDYQEYHIHPCSHFSAVYYVKANKNCGDFVIRSIEGWSDMMFLDREENNRFNADCYNYEPLPSKLLIFKSNLPHMVKKNKSEEDRVSISINFRMEE